MERQKRKIIIDTDPGVDDSVCLIYALTDPRVETLLLTTVVGNIGIETATRNALHLLDILQKDIPVAKGQPTAMYRTSATAEFIHQILKGGNKICHIRTSPAYREDSSAPLFWPFPRLQHPLPCG